MVPGPHLRRELPLKSNPSQLEGQGFDDTGTYSARFEGPTSQRENDTIDELDRLERAMPAKMALDDGLRVHNLEIDDKRSETLSESRIGQSEELELLRHLTEPRTRLGQLLDSPSRRRSHKKKVRRKRGASLEREIAKLVLQNMPDASLEKVAAVSREDLRENVNLSTNEILSDLVKISDANSSISSQSKETVRWINTTSRILEKIQSKEELPHRDQQVGTIDPIFHQPDNVVAAKAPSEYQIESKAADMADSSNLAVAQNDTEWAPFENWPPFDVPLIPSQTLDQNGFPVFDLDAKIDDVGTTASDDDNDTVASEERLAEEEQLAAELSKEMAHELERDRFQELFLIEAQARKASEEEKLREVTQAYEREMAEDNKTREFEGEIEQQRAEEEEEEQRPLENQEIPEERTTVNMKQLQKEPNTSMEISGQTARSIERLDGDERARHIALDLRREAQAEFRRISQDLDFVESNSGHSRNEVDNPFVLHPRSIKSNRTPRVWQMNETQNSEDESSICSSDFQHVLSVEEKGEHRRTFPPIEDTLEIDPRFDRVDSPSNGPERDNKQQSNQMQSIQCMDSPETTVSDATSSDNNTNEPISPASVTDLNSTNGNAARRYNRAKAFVKRRSARRQSSPHAKQATWNPKPPQHYNSRAVLDQSEEN
jgi:hypothetical protein